MRLKMQKPQAILRFCLREKKERKNEKDDIKIYATIITNKCEENKCINFKKVLS